MKVPLSWLKEYLRDLSVSVDTLSETLTLAGLEVESVTTVGSNFSGVVVAKVLSTAPHPNADRLCVAKVFDGTEELQVVCGAKNCRPGLVTALARIGATLTDENQKSFKIKKGKLREVESYGMLCAADELGLPSQGEGILELSEEIALGTDIASLFADTIIDVSLTPNLGHCMSILGIAREMSAFLKTPLDKPSFSLDEDKASSIEKMLQVDVQDKTNCLRYAARMVCGVKVGPSPSWLKQKIEACGLRSINNVVDVSNYIMLELGQPLHMFDYNKIAKGKLVIGSQTPYTKIKTLDGEERELHKDMLLICDEARPLAIGGIIGGEDSSVTETTTNVVIEAALFLPSSIRKSSKMLSLKTDSSQRFEKGIDAQGILFALERAAFLLQQAAGGNIVHGAIDKNIHPFIAKKLSCRQARVNTLLGTDLSLSEISVLLGRLGIKTVKEHPHSLEVLIPSFRNDLQEEIDLIEEVARIYGFNNIPKVAPLHVSSPLTDAPIYVMENEARDRLLSEGLQEMVSCDLTSPSLAALSSESGLSDQCLLSVMHSKSIDYSILRSSLLPGLLQSLKHNIDHQNHNVSGFEIGRVHFKTEETVKELSCIGIMLSGQSTPYHHDPKPRDVDFFDLKGIVENLLMSLHIPACTFEMSHLHTLQPGKQAKIKVGTSTLGVIGEVHPNTLQKLDIKQRVFFGELNLHEILDLKKAQVTIQDLPQFPGSERDWTLTVKSDTPVGTLLSAIKAHHSPYLESAFLLDLYQSEKLGKDKKNITLRFVYRDKGGTLSFDAVDAEHTKLTQKVAEKLHDCLL